MDLVASAEASHGAPMRAVLCDRFEGIGALRTGETAEPVPAADEILIDVHAASVSYMDYLMASGGYQMRRRSLTCRERMPQGSWLRSATR